jgi:HAD superfamily hydrolase (TIGR01509 family)
MRLRGIILDLDGVVAETEDIHRQAYNAAFEEEGLPLRWSYQDYRARFTLSGGQKLADLPVPTGETPAVYQGRLYQKKRQHYVRLLHAAPLPPRPGVLRLVDAALAADVRLAAASTCAREGALAILDRCLGPERVKRFAAIQAGDDAPRRKPAPDVYLQALQELNLPPEVCVAIEDSRHGIEAAKAAGLWTLATPSQYTLGDDFSAADLVVEDLDAGPITLERLDSEVRLALA